jgi:hypothetical protein
MKAPWSLIVPLALLSSCHPPEDESAYAAAPAAPSSAAPSSAAPTPSVITPSGTYAVENLLDLKRKRITRFAYAQETDLLFVSFGDPPKMEGKPAPPMHQNELEQWNVSEGKMQFRYELPEPWIIDDMFPSPDGLVLGARHYRTGDVGGCKLSVIDTVTHTTLAERLCIEPDGRSSRVEFTASGDFAFSNPSAPTPAKELAGFDRNGRPRTLQAMSLVRDEPCKPCDFVPNQKGRTDHGLFFTDKDGKRHLVAENNWPDNFALSSDGTLLVTTTWDGEVIGWSTTESRRLFTIKWTDSYGHLAYDKKRDRFLLGEVVSTGTSFLRVLTRKP